MARRTKEEGALTRESLLRAALAAFSTKGYAAATLEDVAAKAGITRGAIYWHFGSKAELYTACREALAPGRAPSPRSPAGKPVAAGGIRLECEAQGPTGATG